MIRFSQIIMRKSSLTTMTFIFPVSAMLYYVHINPFDTNIGTLDSEAMEDMIKNLFAKKEAVYLYQPAACEQKCKRDIRRRISLFAVHIVMIDYVNLEYHVKEKLFLRFLLTKQTGLRMLIPAETYAFI